MKRAWILLLALAAVLAGGATRIVQDQCGPFTDVTPGFCPYVLELYYLGITAGTSATTFSPDDPLTRGQGAVFIAKGLNQSLARSSRRAALGQWWTTQSGQRIGVGGLPYLPASDGVDVWVPGFDGTVSRIRASDGKLLETWTGAGTARGVLVAMGRIFVTSGISPGSLYMIDPSMPAGAVTLVASGLGGQGGSPFGVAFDGARIWTANNTTPGSISIVTPGPTLPWPSTTLTTSLSNPFGALFDGSNIWMTDGSQTALARFDSDGNVIQSVPVGNGPGFPVFDGSSIWVPNFADNTVTVVRASTGEVVQTLTGNGMNGPRGAAFDGERVLVTNFFGGSVSIWRSADLAPLGTLQAGVATGPFGACSDGIRFWVALNNANGVARF